MTALDVYSGGGINPIFDDAQALTDAVVLPASKLLLKGTVLGQILGSGTAVNEVQTLTASGTISGGTWIIVYDGEMTTALAFNASTATIQAALEALPSIGTGGIVVTGSGINAGNPILTFSGTLTGGLHHPLVSVINSLTGTTPVVTPGLTTLGNPAGGYWDAYDDAASGSFAGLAIARRILKYDSRSDSNGRIYPGTTKGGSDNRSYSRNTPAYYSGTFQTGNGSALVLPGLDANGVADLGRLIAGTTATLTAATTILRMG